MSRNKKLKFTNIFYEATIFIFIVMLLINPQRYSSVALNGVIVWAKILLPSLFPFFVFSKLFQQFNVTEMISKSTESVMKKLYNVNGKCSYIFALSILSGYPVGSKLTGDLFESGEITRGEAIRTVSFTSNSGPMFIIGTVGNSLLLSFKSGIIMLTSHFLGSIINGLLYRKYKINDTYSKELTTEEKKQHSFGDAITNSIASILNVGGYVCIFFVIAEICSAIHFFEPLCSALECFNIDSNITNAVFNGILEITNGCKCMAQTNASLFIKTTLSCLIISFGGISTLIQSFHFLKPVGIKLKELFLLKITHALISTIICICLLLLFL